MHSVLFIQPFSAEGARDGLLPPHQPSGGPMPFVEEKGVHLLTWYILPPPLVRHCRGNPQVRYNGQHTSGLPLRQLELPRGGFGSAHTKTHEVYNAWKTFPTAASCPCLLRVYLSIIFNTRTLIIAVNKPRGVKHRLRPVIATGMPGNPSNT